MPSQKYKQSNLVKFIDGHNLYLHISDITNASHITTSHGLYAKTSIQHDPYGPIHKEMLLWIKRFTKSGVISLNQSDESFA